jgi:hypothetical protein
MEQMHSLLTANKIHQDITHMLLNTQFLELDKLGSARLQIKTATRLIHSAVRTWTHHQWHECEGINLSKEYKI